MISFPPQLIIMAIAMLPISELRGAIPLGLTVYHLSPLSVYFWAVLGNILPIIFILLLLEPISQFLSERIPLLKRFFNWLFRRTRINNSKRFEIWGALALVTFVAIPLPMTGGWTGAIAAYVFGIPFKKALPLIFLGILIAGCIMTLGSLGFLALSI